ncbi:MAG: folate family ECF transporter S component [Eubacteriales bacterium]|nr:folate family ECF transporter S component [Eubacteriales bacterium]
MSKKETMTPSTRRHLFDGLVRSAREFRQVHTFITVGMLLALQLALKGIGFQLPFLRIGIAFIPEMVCAAFFGPLPAMLLGAGSDVLGYFLGLSGPGNFFPGFTVTALLAGLIYGSLLYQKPAGLLRFAIAKATVNIFLNIGLNTLWLSILQGKGYLALLPLRITKNLVMLPIEIALAFLVVSFLQKQRIMSRLSRPA